MLFFAIIAELFFLFSSNKQSKDDCDGSSTGFRGCYLNSKFLQDASATFKWLPLKLSP